MYKGDIRKRTLLKRVPLIRLFGESAVELSGMLCLMLAIISLLSIEKIFFLFEPSLEGRLYASLSVIILFFSFSACGHELLFSKDYVKAARCRECGKEFACEEREKPDIKEVSAPDYYYVTVIRHWKCRYCGCEDSSESQENIESRKGKRNKEPFSTFCEHCGKSTFQREFKDPDIKELKTSSSTSDLIITRYYQCGHCGYRSVRAEKEEHINAADMPVRKWAIEDSRMHRH